MTRLYLALSAWATRRAGLTPPPHDPHRCPRCLQPVGAVGWHITGREHDSCAGRVEPLHSLIEKGTL